MPRRSRDVATRRGDATADRGRRVVRTLRRVELWTVFRLSGCVYLALWAMGLLALAVIWWISSNTGTTSNIESFLRDVGFKNFEFNGPELLLAAGLGGLVLVLAGTLLTTVLAALVNLISELTGGLKVVVIEPPGVDLPVGGTVPAAAAATFSPDVGVAVAPPVVATFGTGGPATNGEPDLAPAAHYRVRAATGSANPGRGAAPGAGSPAEPAHGDPRLAASDAADDSWSARAGRLLRGVANPRGPVRTEPD
ncbi:MAG TPA: DUF3566 domain-containing protein [Acidimicrobiales bacterium]|nr:DUF3566 domain-containing protein [Acidimicrobiales bacterium]